MNMSSLNPRKRNRTNPSVSRKQKRSSPPVSRKENNPLVYQKRRVTCGFNGFYYEIKLAGLIHLNLKHDDKVKTFLLATNLTAAWPTFDDICFKIKWKDIERKPTIVFIQSKHKMNHKKPVITLVEIFEGYRNIQNKFNAKDGLFEGKFNECECFFILYTNEDFGLNTVPLTDDCAELNDVIGTDADGTVTRLSKNEKENLIKGWSKTGKDWSANDNLMWEHFLNRLLLFCRQANEKGVESILREYVADYQTTLKNSFQVTTEAATAVYIKNIVNWWETLDEAPYLTEKDELLKLSFNGIIKNPLMSALNVIYFNNKIKHNYIFSDDAVNSLNLQDHSSTAIITENSVLTVVKVLQHLQNKDHVVLDLESIASLQHRARKTLCIELKTKEDNVIIMVCDKIPENKSFKDIGEAIKNKKLILISNNKKSYQNLRVSFPVGEGEEYREVYDKKNRLIDMSEESQQKILETVKVMFQDKEVNLADIVNNESKVFVKGDVLNEICNEKMIAFGKLIVKSNYDEIKDFWINRRIQKRESDTNEPILVPFKTLNDREDHIVLVTAKPGMGKSTLLTHLSLETKEVNPHVWIIRINLLEYSEEFNNWKENKIVVDLLQTLKFMCQVLLREKLGKDNKVEIILDEKDNIVFLKHCTADPITEFELNLFLHFYCEREMIFLFDGFDEICPHYTDVVIKCLKIVSNDPRKHRMWITSRPYNVVKTILEKEFVPSYGIDSFTEMEEYLHKFWKANLKLEELNDTQLENVKTLLKHVSSVIEIQKAEFGSDNYDSDDPYYGEIIEPNKSLSGIIKTAALYLSYKIKNTHIPLWKHKNNYHDIFRDDENDCDCCSCYYCFGSCKECDNYDDDRRSTNLISFASESSPLILYLAAVFVVQNIKKEDNNFEKWYLEFDDYTVYEKFLENKIRRRYVEKNGMNIFTPDINTAYKNKCTVSILKHKILGAYTIFNEYGQRLFKKESLENIKDMIKVVEGGEEKADLVDSVANGIPIFIHKTFAEYFAVEYVCDRLKNENISQEEVTLYFDIIFSNEDIDPDHKMYENMRDVRSIFNHKINIDKTLVSALTNERNADELFQWIWRTADPNRRLSLSCIALEQLKNVRTFFDVIIHSRPSQANGPCRDVHPYESDKLRGIIYRALRSHKSIRNVLGHIYNTSLIDSMASNSSVPQWLRSYALARCRNKLESDDDDDEHDWD